MSPEALKGMLNRKPFVPFRIHVSDQASYDVHNPQMVLMGGAAIFIGISRHDTTSDLWDEPVIVANRHITRIEPLVNEVAG